MAFRQAKKDLPVAEGTVVTAVGHSNIAFVKYWGKRVPQLNLPTNSSISMTLDDKFKTTTSVLFSNKLEADQVYIDDQLQEMSEGKVAEKSKFIKLVLDQMRARAGSKTNALIVSQNSFPASSGMASSASGAATLVFALSTALNLKLEPKDMSVLARQISGSACRSLYGGIVEWEKGSSLDGSDSYAKQVVGPEYWPNLIDMVVLVDTSKKKVSSSEGHALVETSPLYPNRPPFAEENMAKIKGAILKQDFNSMAEIIMRESNSMHAIMLDSWPPIIYLTDASKAIMVAIHELNAKNGRNVAAYTFDAGPNAHIITTKDQDPIIRDALSKIDSIKEIIVSGMGDAPKLVKTSLIDAQNLKPLLRAKK